jgi:hypothetical protein
MSYSDSSQLLNKQAELKTLQAKYDSYIKKYTAIEQTTTTPLPNDINAISRTNPPSGIRPGEDFGEYWKFVSSGATDASACWTNAARDPRVFQKVVYTGANNATSTSTNNGDATWNQQCYGLVWNAPREASYTTNARGYSTMVSSNGFTDPTDRIARTYTKSSITTSATLNEASEITDLKTRIDALIEEIALIANSSINNELSALSQTSADQKTVIQKINQYMNSSTQQIDASNNIIEQRKNMNNVYEDINKQITLNSRKFKFVLYCLIGVIIIISYLVYVSKSIINPATVVASLVGLVFIIMYLLYALKGTTEPTTAVSTLIGMIFIITYLLYVSKIIVDPDAAVSIAVSWGWWFNWSIITFVVALLILSSFGWDMRGNIMMIWRYISDPDFWTGQFWWVGVSFLFLFVIFLHATFKSFFAPAFSSLEKMGGEDDDD